VPLLEDGEFRLTESSAILKYLADKSQSPAYPIDLRQRARINERMDWFNTGFYRDLGYGLVYPQVIPSYRRDNGAVQRAVLASGREKAKNWLKILDDHFIGPENKFVCGNEITIADYFGASILTLGDVIRLDYSPYPNVVRWIGNMKALPAWPKANEAFYASFVGPFKDTPFEGL
jgi:glutathione S-transferase